MKKPLVSIIVPTYNSAATLTECLQSIKIQTYSNTELIVVDNSSKDDTKQIAKKFTNYVYNKAPERSAQRNYGVEKAKGDIVMIIDSDMQLQPDVVKECIGQFELTDVAGVIIPEESFGEGFWAQCKRLERSFYVGISWMEAARAFRRQDYLKLGGYNETMVSGEDWDLSQRAESLGKIAHINSFILHNEGKLKLSTTLKKKYYYAQKFAAYRSEHSSHQNVSKQTGPITRYKLFFSKPIKLLKSPHVGLGMLFMKTSEFAVGAAGLLKNANR